MGPDEGRNTARCRFSSTNYWGIPDLLPARMARIVPGDDNPFFIYRMQKLTPKKAHGGILGFFVDDYRFACCWSYPARMTKALLDLGLAAVCEPDFSVYTDDPIAVQLHAAYRMRWCGRYFQEAGLDLIPTLTWGDARSFDFCWAGIPVECPVAAIENRNCGAKWHKQFNIGLRTALEEVAPKVLIVYGERRLSGWMDLPPGQAVYWVEPPTNKRFRELKNGQARR